MDETNSIDQLFSEGEKQMKEAGKTSKGPIEGLVSMKDRGYLPEMTVGTAAAAYAGLGVKNYVQNLKAVKAAIEAEEQAVKQLRTPSTKKGAQPFAKEGFTLSGAKDVKAVMPQKGGGVPYTRLSNVMPIGGPEGTGLGVLKGKEKATAARMTAEQMIRYLRQQSNFGVTATTPRIQVKGFQEGETGRKTVVLSPEDVKAGKLPTTQLPAGELPRPPATTTARILRSPLTLAEYLKGKFGGTTKLAGFGFDYAPLVINEMIRAKSDYENPVTGEVYKKNQVTDIGGMNYATADLATIAMFHPDNAENHPEITDEMRKAFFQRK